MLLMLKTKVVEFANDVDQLEAAHYEPSHLDLHCLPSSHYDIAFTKLFF